LDGTGSQPTLGRRFLGLTECHGGQADLFFFENK
jgi:hypothetical protein